MSQIKLSIFGRERSKETDGKVEKFCKYSFTPDGVDFYEIVFKKECVMTPKTSGYWKITVEEDDIDFKDGKVVEGQKRPNKMYISNVVKIEKDTEAEEAYKAKRVEKRKSVLSKLTGEVNE